MSDLDKKLEALLKALVFDEWRDDSYLPGYKKAITQAFIDAGWVVGRVATELNGRVYIANGVDPIKHIRDSTEMEA